MKSDDPKTQVTAVLQFMGENYICAANTFADGLEKKTDRPYINDFITHAERKAIYMAARNGFCTAGSTMHLDWYPCLDCAQAISEAGISNLVCKEPDWNHHKWGDQFKKAKALLDQTGVRVDYSLPGDITNSPTTER